MASLKRPALADSADHARKLTKKQRRRERKQTPAEKIEYHYRIQVQECAQQNDAFRALKVYEEMKNEGVKVAPYIYNVVINVCSKADDPVAFKSGAYKVYQDMKQAKTLMVQTKNAESDEPMYSAMIKLCSKAQDFETCEQILAEMEAAKVVPKLRTFSTLLQMHSDGGNLEKCFWVHDLMLAHELSLAEEDYVALLRACVKTGSALRFYTVLNTLIEEIWQPSLMTWQVLTAWFTSEAAQVDGCKWKITEETVTSDGQCLETGDQLQSIELSPEQTTELLAKIEKLVRTDEQRRAQWDEFKHWLEAFGPFDVVIDGANVGYCNQNFDGGGFNYAQIEHMMQHYETQSKKVLLVLHARRISDQQVPITYRARVAQWRRQHSMFNCQPGNNDDWYWLYAAVKLGGRTLMVSNDEMRDHHFQMIHNRAFRRWKERHQVHYQVHGPRVTVDEPLPYSVRPQRVGDTWYFPASDPTMNDSNVSETASLPVADRKWLCIQLIRTA